MESGANRKGPLSLVLIQKPRRQTRADLPVIAEKVAALDRRVRPVLVRDRAQRWRRRWLARRPATVVSIAEPHHFEPSRGAFFHGLPLNKSEEYAALDAAGVPVPRWALLTKTHTPNLDAFGPYVVVKPDDGGLGADIHVYKKQRVRWKPRKVAVLTPGHGDDRIVQEFIYTGRWPSSYRVWTFFGRVTWAIRIEGSHDRPGLTDRYAFREVARAGAGAACIVSNSSGCTMAYADDEEIIRLAERAHVAAFPTVPFLGVDVVREQPSGKLYILEVNASGYAWHFSAGYGKRLQQDFDIDGYTQFDAMDRVAESLVAKTLETAC